MTPVGARPVEQVAPPPKRPEPPAPATPPKPDVDDGADEAAAEAAQADAKPTTTAVAAVTQPPTTGAQVATGTSRASRRARAARAPGSPSAAAAAAARRRRRPDFCCPDVPAGGACGASAPTGSSDAAGARHDDHDRSTIQRDGTFTDVDSRDSRAAARCSIDLTRRARSTTLKLPPLPAEYTRRSPDDSPDVPVREVMMSDRSLVARRCRGASALVLAAAPARRGRRRACDPRPPPAADQTSDVSLDRTPASHPKVGDSGLSSRPATPTLREAAATTLADVLWARPRLRARVLRDSAQGVGGDSGRGDAGGAAVRALDRARRGLSCCSAPCAKPAARSIDRGPARQRARRPPRHGQASAQAYDGCTRVTNAALLRALDRRRHPQEAAQSRRRRAHEARVHVRSRRDADDGPADRRTPAQGKEIYITDYDGANQRRVTANRSLNIAPAWAPDGGRSPTRRTSSGFPDIYVRHLLDGAAAARARRGGTTTSRTSSPAMSPDGTKIAFASNARQRQLRTSGSSIATARTCSNLTPNTPTSTESAPTWSPDRHADRVHVGSRPARNQIYVMNADGTGRAAAHVRRQSCDRPTWSPLELHRVHRRATGPGTTSRVYDLSAMQTRRS